MPTIDKGLLFEALEGSWEFQELSFEEKEELLNIPQNEADVIDLLAPDVDFQGLKPEEQEEFAKMVVSHEDDYTLGALGSGIDKLVGGIGSGISGVGKAFVESGINPMYWGEDNSLTKGTLEGLEAIKDYSQGLQQKAHTYEEEQLSAGGRFASDVGVLITEQVALTLATGGADKFVKGGQALASGLAFAFKGMGEKYNQMRDTRHTVGESLTRASATGALQGVTEAVTVGMATKLATPLLKRTLQTSLMAGGLGSATEIAEISADYVVDKLSSEVDTDKLLDPNEDMYGYAVRVLRTGGLGALGALGTHAGSELVERHNLYRTGRKKTYIRQSEGKEGMYFYYDKDIPSHLAEVAGAAVQDKAFNGFSQEQKQGIFNKTMDDVLNVMVKKQDNSFRETDTITKPIQDVVSRAEGNLDMQEGHIVDKPVSLNDGDIVGVMPDAEGIVVLGNTKVKEPYRATIQNEVKQKDGRAAKRFNVLLEAKDSKGEVKEPIPLQVFERDLVNYDSTVAKWRKQAGQAESWQISEFVKEVFSNNAKWADATDEQKRILMGSMFKVSKNIKGNAIGAADTKKGYIYNLITNKNMDVEGANRVFTHEIGHILLDADKAFLQNMGLEKMESFSDFININPDSKGLTLADQNIFADFVKESKGNMKRARDKFIEHKYGSDLDIISDNWNLYANRKGKLTATEKMADALSAFINKPNMADTDPMKSTKIYEDFVSWVDNNANVKVAFDNLKDSANGIGESVTSKFKKSFVQNDEIAMKDMPQTLTDKIKGNNISIKEHLIQKYVDRYHPVKELIRRGLSDEAYFKAERIIDEYYLKPELIRRGTKEFMALLEKGGFETSDLNVYMLFDKVINDRTLKHKAFVGDMDAITQDADAHTEVIRKTLLEEGSLTEEAIMQKTAEIREVFIKEEVGRRTINKNVEMANPNSLTREQAGQEMANLKSSLGKEGFDSLINGRRKMQDIFIDRILPMLDSSGIYHPDQVKHMKNNIHYSKFDVTKHRFNEIVKRVMSKSNTSGYFQQQGTTSEISSPSLATWDNWSQMAFKADHAQMKRSILQMMAAADPDGVHIKQLGENSNNIKDLYKYSDQKGDNGWQIETVHQYAEDGSVLVQHFQVREDMMRSFVSDSYEKGMAGIWRGVNQLYRSGLTQYNPLFWPYAFIKDVTSTVMRLDGLDSLRTIPDASVTFIKHIRDRYKGNPTERYDAMQADGLLQGGSFGQADPRIEAKLSLQRKERGGMSFKSLQGIQNIFLKGLDNWKAALDVIGEASEFSTKDAALKYFERKNKGAELTDLQRRIIRREAGSPLFAQKGLNSGIAGNILYFFNPAVQGTAAGIENVRRDPMNTITKTVMSSVAKNSMRAAMLLGVFGEDIKEAVGRIPFQEWASKNIIPLGVDSDGKAVYASAPKDEFTQMIDTVVEGMVHPILADENTFRQRMGWESTNGLPVSMTFGEGAKEAVSGLVNNTPSANPFLKGGWQASKLAMGENPVDTFTGRDYFDRGVMARNDDWEKSKIVMNKMYESIPMLPQFYRFNFKAEPKGSDRTDPKFQKRVVDYLNDATDVPILGSLAGKFIRTTAYGSTEKINRIATREGSAKARLNRDIRVGLEEAVFTPENLNYEGIKEIMGIASKDPDYARRVTRELQKKTVLESMPPMIKPLVKRLHRGNKAEKKVIMGMIYNVLSNRY